MKVVAYTAVLPPNNKNVEKGEILYKFALGVAKVGDEIIIHNRSDLIDCDVALSIGWVHENSKNTPHLNFRKRLIEHQISNNKKVLLADSSLFLYKNTNNPLHYLRYSFNGIFPNTGVYCDNNPNSDRWKKISQDTGIVLKDYRRTGNHILLCLQRNGGWSMGGYDVIDWTSKIIKELRQHTDRELVIRAHPGDKNSKNYLSPENLLKKLGRQSKVRLSVPGSTLEQDLKNCWAVVNYNSSPAVGAAIEGFPVFVTDPIRSQASEIANTDITKIENPDYPDRLQWIERISMFHWNFDEISNGTCWAHMRNYI